MGFSPSSALRFGWETFKKRPWFFIGAFVLIAIAHSIAVGLSQPSDAPFAETADGVSFLGRLVALVLVTLISMGVTAFGLAAHDNPESVELSALWRPHPFWKYLGMLILLWLVIGVGLLLLVVPGIIFALMFMFSTFLMIDRGLGPIEAMKESHRITRGYKWSLFGFTLLLVLVNLAGLLALFVGIFVSAPVSLLALTHAYRVLSGGAVLRPADVARAA